MTQVIESLIATANKGHADFFLQFVGTPPQKFSLVAGLHVEDGRKLAAGLTGLLRQITQLKLEQAPEISLNATYKNVTFHRITPKRIPRQMQRVFGEKPSILVGAGSRTVWVAVGGKDALTALRQSMDRVSDRSKIGKKRAAAAPFQFVVNISSWLAIAGDENGRPNAGRDLARKAFSKGGDSIRVELRPTENGIRIRAQFGAGFIRLIGMSIHRRYERNQGNL